MATPAGERRIVSVLLADISGSTTIAEQLGAERSKFLFDEVVLLLAGEIKRFGGKSDAVEAFRVAGEREAEELAVLDEVLGDLVEGGGAIVAITGEPGIGKSRLTREARTGWQDNVRFLGTQGVSYAQDVPYYPFRELLRGFLEIGVGDPEARVRLELKMRLGSVLGERADGLYPFLAPLLGLGLEGDARERLQTLARDSVQRHTHEAVTALLEALSRAPHRRHSLSARVWGHHPSDAARPLARSRAAVRPRARPGPARRGRVSGRPRAPRPAASPCRRRLHRGVPRRS